MTRDELQEAITAATQLVAERQEAVDNLDTREDQIRDYFTYDLQTAERELEQLRHMYDTGQYHAHHYHY